MSDTGFGRFFLRVTACHMVTYTIAGILAFYLADYQHSFASEHLACYMLPTSSMWVAAGPGLQVIRGLIFALCLYPFRHVFLDEPRGWLKLWGLVVGLAILSTAGPSPGSIEGMIYTRIPVRDQILGLHETLGQTLAFSILLVLWYRRPHRAWGIVMSIATALVLLMSLAGALAARPANLG
ncbi:MAG TPA: hypothetical protein VMX54_04035 [Vicinamibacteria bacterium]|nr:hypothetical protein [Vicinamibacteria bacterium]